MTGKSRRFAEVGFVVMWSSGFIGARLGTPEASTPTLMAWRFLLAAGLLLVGAFLLQRRLPDLREIAVQSVVGLLAQGVYLTGVVGAVEFGVTAGTSALVAALQPLLAAALTGPVLGERVSRQQWAGLAVGLVGVTLVVGGHAGGAQGKSPKERSPGKCQCKSEGGLRRGRCRDAAGRGACGTVRRERP